MKFEDFQSEAIALLSSSPMKASDLARKTGASSAVYQWLKKMVIAGTVVKGEDGLYRLPDVNDLSEAFVEERIAEVEVIEMRMPRSAMTVEKFTAKDGHIVPKSGSTASGDTSKESSNVKNRFLSQKKLRNALFLGSEGRCQSCGCELPRVWHADHITPFCESQNTNVHEMQALCPQCHIKKTTLENQERTMKKFNSGRYYSDPNFQPRGHQRDFIAWIEESFLGTGEKFCGMHATPGAGKSALPEIVSQLIEVGLLDQIVWVVPRDSLKKQGAESFTKETKWNPIYKAYEANNKAPLIASSDIKDGRRCLTVTYAGIASAPDLWIDWVKKHRTALLLDEGHHLCDDDTAKWLEAITPLVDASVLCLAMTGTVERHDNKPLPFFHYEDRAVGGVIKKFVVPDIQYTRSQALAEQAKLPIKFAMTKGWANWIDDDGEHAYDISECDKQYEGKVVKCILSDDVFIQSILNESLSHYLKYRKDHQNAKFIGVFSFCSEAYKWCQWVMEKYPSLKIGIAVSEEKKLDVEKGRQAIDRFKLNNSERESYDVLFTVGMAYEGLDVPSATHLVCLTNKRSFAWLEQCFDRCSRIDYAAISQGLDYEMQQAYVWVPDDPRMKRVVEYIQDEQQIGIKLKEEKPPEDGPKPPPPPPKEGFFLSLAAEVDGRYYADTNTFYSMSDSELLERIIEQYHPVRNWTPKQILDLYKIGGLPLVDVKPKEERKEKYRQNQIEYYKERADGRESLSKAVHRLTNRCDALAGNPFGAFAGQFGKQTEWGIDELWDLRIKALEEIDRLKAFKRGVA